MTKALEDGEKSKADVKYGVIKESGGEKVVGVEWSGVE